MTYGPFYNWYLEDLEESQIPEAINNLLKKKKELQKELADLKKEQQDERKEYDEQTQKLMEGYEQKIREIKETLRAFAEIADQMEAQGFYPPIFVGRYLRRGANVPVLVPQEDKNLPPKKVWVKTAVVLTRDGEQTVVINPKIDLAKRKFKRGERVWLAKNPMGFAILLRLAPQVFSGEEKVVQVKRVIDKKRIYYVSAGEVKIALVKGSCEPLEAGDRVIFDSHCNFVVCKAPPIEEEVDRKRIDPVTYKDVGGLENVIYQIKEVVELPFKHPELFEKLGTRAPRSILLTGPPGTGKTLLARATANEIDMLFMARSGGEFRSSFPGEDVEKIKLMFDEAEKEARESSKGVILFIDEIESLCPIRSSLHSGQHDIEALENFFFARMEGLKGRGNVIVIAASNQIDKMDIAGISRFDKVISVPIPSQEGRLEIVKIHTRKMALAEDVDTREISEKTKGFTGRDIEHLCIEAGLAAKKVLDDKLKDGTLTRADIDSLSVNRINFFSILDRMEPSGLAHSDVIMNTGVTFDDVAGLEVVKRMLKREVSLLLGGNKLYQKSGMKTRKGILLVSLPGYGKTLIAKALATECGMNFLNLKGSTVHSVWHSISEKQLSAAFEATRMHPPAILFIDEVDSLFPRRRESLGGVRVDEKMVATFNVEMDGIEELKEVIVIAATNRPDLVDPAVIRRLCPTGKPIVIPPLDKDGRKKAFEIHSRGKVLADDVGFEELAEITGKRRKVIVFPDRVFIEIVPFNGDEIRGVCEEATRLALDEFEEKYGLEKAQEKADEFCIHQHHFIEAITGKLERDMKSHEDVEGLDIGGEEDEETCANCGGHKCAGCVEAEEDDDFGKDIKNDLKKLGISNIPL